MDIQKNVSLRAYNTFGIDVKTKYFSSFYSIESVKELLSGLKQQNLNLKLILGGGSNILFTKDFYGIVLKNEIRGLEMVKEDEEHIYIRSGGGENWHQFVL